MRAESLGTKFKTIVEAPDNDLEKLRKKAAKYIKNKWIIKK